MVSQQQLNVLKLLDNFLIDSALMKQEFAVRTLKFP